MWQIGRTIGMALLVGMSIEDIRFRKISGCLLGMAAVLGIYYQLVQKELMAGAMIGGLGIGAGFLLLSYLTKEGIGYGDSLLICVLGIFVGGAELIEILLITWMAAGVSSMFMLTRRKFSRKVSIPFVPFVTVSYALVTLETYIGNTVG